ncbi:ATP-dependent nuclease [Serratia marcescens]|uniref:ATP-dependent nuclease n=1 Tax=Serratia marcescens TaxID=615 RepID=UPI000CCBD7D5|nr:AAA family ATPase [Serratia marcescens]PNU31682.1 ATP-dependent endonuclease [Serratia marcescens]PNU51080.1 ATP-dependent endonuclease [Serratia marcescens]
MIITQVVIENFKGFKNRFSLKLNEGVNILVGDNEAGKSTILEAIHFALTGMYNGRSIKNNLSQYLFNEQAVKEYIESFAGEDVKAPPTMLVELYFKETAETAILTGDGNSSGIPSPGIFIKVEFDDDYNSAYEDMIAAGEVKTLPVEYYRVTWKGFSRASIISRNIPIKSAFIDSTASRSNNGSDVYISRIIKELLTSEEVISVSQSHRKMKESFMMDPAIEAINGKIKTASKITDKDVKISVELSSQNAWENSLITCLDEIPFHFIGKGEQSIVKTNLALAHNKAKEASVVLIEEPENHLSHSKLNNLIKTIKDNCAGKQILITTHSSFVANKLGLGELILLSDKKTTKLTDLKESTREFFEKIAGYDTLRLILCKKAILVEGDSDELVVQKAYMVSNDGRLPIEDGIEVISVGISFLRFLEIASHLGKQTYVLTDNDGDVGALERKYEEYLGGNKKENIEILYDPEVDVGDLKIGEKKFNYNTLEPKILKINGRAVINTVLGTDFDEDDKLHVYMKKNKTECALKIFNYDDNAVEIKYPDYILDALK